MSSNSARSDPLAKFVTTVAECGYRVVEAPWGTVLTQCDKSPGPRRSVYPFSKDNATLFQTFASLRPTNDAILLFANRYGLLGPPMTLDWSSDSDPTHAVEGIRLRRIIARKDINRRDPEGPSRNHTWMNQIRLMRGFLDFANGQPGPYPRNLKERVNTIWRETCGPSADWTDEPGDVEVRETLLPRSLLGALWLQALRSTAKKDFRPCAVCQRPMEISREPTTGKRSHTKWCSKKCAVRAYRQRKREAVQLAQQGRTPASIAKELGSTTATVKGWLKANK